MKKSFKPYSAFDYAIAAHPQYPKVTQVFHEPLRKQRFNYPLYCKLGLVKLLKALAIHSELADKKHLDVILHFTSNAEDQYQLLILYWRFAGVLKTTPTKMLRERKQQEILELRERGYSYEEIKNMTGLSIPVIYRYLKRAGRTRKQNDPEVKKKIVELRKQGKTYREIQQITGKSKRFIDACLEEAGLKTRKFKRKRRPVTDLDRRMIIELRKKGYSIPAIAEAVHRPVGTVYNVLKAANL